jgi:ABC-type sugar transport system permease subunit
VSTPASPTPQITLRKKNKIKDKLNLLAFLGPTLFFVIIFIAFPVVFSGFLSLTEFNYAQDDAPTFVGLAGYYERLVEDGFFHTALTNQMKFAAAYFFITFVVSLLVAILINELNHGVQIFQVIFYMPMIIPLSLVGITFAWILSPDVGFVNHVLRSIGLGDLATNWLGNPETALYSLVLARSWKMIGFTLIIFLAGLQGISSNLREAARVDGANFFQEIFFVVLPNLKPYMLVSGIWILINSIKVYELPAVVTEGGPGQATLTLYLYSWKLAFERLDMGEASQVAYITAAIILILTWVLNRIFRPETAQRG